LSSGKARGGEVAESSRSLPNMAMMMIKMKLQGLVDPLMYKEDEDEDGTAMKANVFGRYAALASAGLMVACGVIGFAIGGFCLVSAVWGWLFFYAILNMELYHYLLPTEEKPAEDEAGAPKEEEADDEDSDDSDDEEKKPGCCARCCASCKHRLRKWQYYCCLKWPGPKHIYENFYIRAVCYIVLGIPMWPCAITMAGGLFLSITGVLYAFARCRGEKERVLDVPEDPEDPEAGKEDAEDLKDEPAEAEAPKKGRRRKA